jgi:phage shock protein A
MTNDATTTNLRIRLFDAVNGDQDVAQAVWEIVSPALAAARHQRDTADSVTAETKKLMQRRTETLRQRAEQAEAKIATLTASVAEYQRKIGYLADDVRQAEAERDAAQHELTMIRDHGALAHAQQRAERAEDAIERARAEHAAIHADADEFERTHNPACECETAPASRVAADRMLAALDTPDTPDHANNHANSHGREHVTGRTHPETHQEDA